MSISAKDVAALRQKTGAGMMDCKKALTENNGDMEAAVKWLREKGMSAAAKREGREASEGRVAIASNDDNTAFAMVEVNSETDFVARNSEFIDLTEHFAREALAMGDKADAKGLIDPDSFNQDPLKALSGKIGEKMELNNAAFFALDGAGLIDQYIHPGDQLGVLIQLGGDEAALGTDAARELAHDLAMQIAAASPQYVKRDEVPQDVIDKEIEIYKNKMRNEGKPEQMLDKIATGMLNKFYSEICLVDQEFVKESKTKVAAKVKEVSKEAGGELEVVRFVRFKVGDNK